MNKLITLFIFLLIIFINKSLATDNDTIKIYYLGAIDIYGFHHREIALSNIKIINYQMLRLLDLDNAIELQKILPASRIRTNSRGESMLFLRGAGERQLGLFFDGVPINIPWDNRFDLSFLPPELIGNITINSNATSALLGPNVLGGAVNFNTYERANDGYSTNIRLQGSNAESYYFSLSNDGKINKFNYIANITYRDAKGDILSSNAPDTLNYQDKDSKFRTNTSKKQLSGYIRGEYDFGFNKSGLSFLFINGEKGVAPETHLPQASTRFWKYPEWNRLLVTLNSETYLAEQFTLNSTFWFDNFSQQIDAYDSSNYQKIVDVQKDKDLTLGARLGLRYMLSSDHRLTAVFNGFITNHKEQINQDPETEFAQNTLSTGLQYHGSFGNLNLIGGILYDYNKTPKTGLFKDFENSSNEDYAAFVNANYYLTDKYSIFGNFSRRTRFPTMREAYSGALNRFKVNPDLKAETGLLSELGLTARFKDFYIQLSGFLNNYDDLIIQKRLSAAEDSLRRRMRMNIAEATITGLELEFGYYGIENLSINGHFTYLNAKGKQEGKELAHLDNKPEMLGGLFINYKLPYNFSLQLESEIIGVQYETDPVKTDQFVKIDGAFKLNGRFGYKLPPFIGVYSEFYIRANNIFDTYHIYQLGLPESGRTIYLGLNLNL